MPGGYSEPPRTLYRGTSANERPRRGYGFSGTIDPALARTLAEARTRPCGGQGIVLEASVPRKAVLLIRKPGDYFMRKPGDYYDEGEVVVNPFRLRKIKVVERLTSDQLSVLQGSS